MPRIDLLEQSATRVELDQRSRDARLRLENVERLLVIRPLPRPSLLRGILRRLGSRIYMGRQINGRSVGGTLNRRPAPQRRRGRAAGAAGGFPAAPPLTWPNCPGHARVSVVARSH